MLMGSVLHIRATFFTIRNTNRIYYYHTVHFLRRINEYCSLNVFFIYVTDTEQKQIQPCCNSTYYVLRKRNFLAKIIFGYNFATNN